MKTNDQIIEMIKQRKLDSVRYASLERLTINRIDGAAWVFLGQAMVGLKRGKMAKLCFERATLFDPFANWFQKAMTDATNVGQGKEDKQVLKLLEVTEVSVSACILTKNNSRTIKHCLEALQEAVDEIVVVDTGSSDGTIQVVESFGIRVHHFDWINDFSAARNYAESLVSSDWVIAIDSDEILFPEDQQNVKLCAALYTDKSMALNVLQMNQINDRVEVFQTARMHCLKDDICWTGPIHEYLQSNEGRTRLEVAPVRIRLFHDGYNPSVIQLDEKLHRNIQILKQALEKEPQNTLYNFYLGREYFNLNQYEDALQHLLTADRLSSSNTKLEVIPEIRKYLYQLFLYFNNKQKAIETIERLTVDYPEYPDGWLMLGIALLDEGDRVKSQMCLENAKQVSLTYRGPCNFDPMVFQKSDQLLLKLRSH